VPEQLTQFVRRMLQDFASQWRHVLRNTYNDITFRKLACAIIRIGTMDFEAVEVAQAQHHHLGGFLVSNFEVPEWKPLESPLIFLGNSTLVLSQNLESTMRMAQ
jgi:hypothetical protein